MNALKFFALLKLLFENKEEILEFLSELASLIETLLSNQHLIGKGVLMAHPDLASSKSPIVANVIANEGWDWKQFLEYLQTNLDTLQKLATILENLLKALRD